MFKCHLKLWVGVSVIIIQTNKLWLFPGFSFTTVKAPRMENCIVDIVLKPTTHEYWDSLNPHPSILFFRARGICSIRLCLEGGGGRTQTCAFEWHFCLNLCKENHMVQIRQWQAQTTDSWTNTWDKIRMCPQRAIKQNSNSSSQTWQTLSRSLSPVIDYEMYSAQWALKCSSCCGCMNQLDFLWARAAMADSASLHSTEMQRLHASTSAATSSLICNFPHILIFLFDFIPLLHLLRALNGFYTGNNLTNHAIL